MKDAQRHGVEVRPIDVARSDWRCTLETPRHPSRPPPLRLGLRYANGLRKDTGLAVEAARAQAPFGCVADLAKRVTLRGDELDTLAELGALASIDSSAGTRRSALWQVAAVDRDRDSLFAGLPPVDTDSPLPEMSPIEQTLADYRNSGLTTGPQIMSHLRPMLRERGILAAAELAGVANGRRVRTAGQVIVRQRPGTAKGFVFLTLEDETGISNAIVTPKIFRRYRVPLHSHSIVEIEGPIQNVEGVIHVRVAHLEGLTGRQNLPESHDYR